MTVILNVMDNPRAFWVVNSLFVFALSVFFAGVLIPQILLISFRKRLFDVPDERKIHQGVVPRLGGIAFNRLFFSRWHLLWESVCCWGTVNFLIKSGMKAVRWHSASALL